MLKKTQACFENLKSLGPILRCPVCGGEFHTVAGGLSCLNGHRADMSKKGTFNFLSAPPKDAYGKDAFIARRKAFEAGLWNSIVKAVRSLLPQDGNKPPVVLDAGCGEGSFLNSLPVCGIGVDNSREGIFLASDFLANGHVWLVGDLKRLPVKSGTVDAVLNILAPAAYDEFDRVLKPGGMLVKVAPADGYLKELREFFAEDIGKAAYSGSAVTEHFFKKYPDGSIQNVRVVFDANADTLLNVLAMTPLSRHFDNNKVSVFLKRKQQMLTIDINVMWRIDHEKN